MPNENTPLYGPGYTVSKDRYGNLADISASLTERWCALGLSWSMTTGYQSLANAADYAYVTFKTPATGRIFYNFARLEKSGNEIVKSLIEGCTATAGTAITPRNYEREVGDASCPVTAVSFGMSASSQTLTGGTEIFPSLATGSAQGASIPGGSSQLQGVVLLKKNTVYALKLLAKGAATFSASVGFGYIATA